MVRQKGGIVRTLVWQTQRGEDMLAWLQELSWATWLYVAVALAVVFCLLAALKWLELKDTITAIIALMVIWVGASQYRTTSDAEFLKPVREAQLKNYQEAASAAAILANYPSSENEWKEAKKEFQRLYFGPLAMFEDFDHNGSLDDYATNPTRFPVEWAMVVFKLCLDDVNECKSLGVDLKALSLGLSHTARQSLGSSWRHDLPQLEGDYQACSLWFLSKYIPLHPDGFPKPYDKLVAMSPPTLSCSSDSNARVKGGE
jgi:hypothetical protein